MIAVVWALVRPLLPYLIGMALLAGGWLYADRACWSTACKKAEAQVVALQAEKDAAIANRNALALKWADAIQNVERVYVESERARSDDFAGIRHRAATGSGASVRVPVDALSAGVLRDAYRAANAGSEAPRPIDETAPAVSQAADTTLNEWVVFAVDAAAAYADAVAKWKGVLQAYEALRSQ